MSRICSALSLLLGVAALLLTQSCKLEEKFDTDPGLELGFSVDTLRFDTVFASTGSATRSFKIYNPSNRPLSVERISLAQSVGGRFRLNIDGIAADEATDVFIPPNDSIYIFAEVTVDPDEDVSVSPFVLEGQVEIEANDVPQVVYLEAFGQNANYIPTSRARQGLNILTCELGEVVFNDPKPYVIYGTLLIDSCTVTLPPGTRLYVHGGLEANADGGPYTEGRLIFFGQGYLNSAGTPEEPVLIAGDRLEERFADARGAYFGIILQSLGKAHTISNTRIRNASYGLIVDSATTLEIDNSEIAYSGLYGLRGFNAKVKATNLIAFGNSSGAVQALYGGDYQFDYCTLVNYESNEPAVLLADGYTDRDENSFTLPLKARVRNSIITGSSGDPLGLVDFGEPELLDYRFDHTYLRITELADSLPDFESRCTDCFFEARTDTLFYDIQQDSFQLDTLSIARGKAVPLPEVTQDILGVERDATAPDLGAYEYVPND